MSTIRMIRVNGGSRSIYTCETAEVDYSPKLKYRIEKKNAFDPTILHQRESYREDTITVEAIMYPEEYQAFVYFLTQEGQFYIEFTMYSTQIRQFQVIITQYPKSSEDMREDADKVKISLESKYISSPGFINFDMFTTMDDHETLY